MKQKIHSINILSPQEQATIFPREPGCYLFKDHNQKILYIGKAKNLKNRIKSYFQNKPQNKKTQNLVKQITFIDYIVTENEKESLILENNLIKKYQPKYNIDLKDAKSYSFIKISREALPRISIERNKNSKGEYYGPFISASDRNSILNIITNLFKIRTCKKMSKKACLRFQINLCDAPCIENISQAEYSGRINEIKMILKGNISQLVKLLKLNMQKFARWQNFEKALVLRNQINALKGLLEKQNMERIKDRNEDIINYIIKNNKVYLMVFRVNKGVLLNKAEFIFDYNESFFEEFLLQYYSESEIPSELVVPQKISEGLKTHFAEKKGKKIKVIQPQKGDKKQLMNLIRKNIEIHFFSNPGKLELLKKSLSLTKIPKIMECFDISHLSGSYTVASMVQFKNGKPHKSSYRRFKIKTVSGIDDYSSIAEVVKRRYNRLIRENKQLPDLIIIDGGPGQLNAAVNELKKMDITPPVISLAKRLEEIYLPGRSCPLLLAINNDALKLLQQVRDEAHRFALNYHRLLRKKGVTAQ